MKFFVKLTLLSLFLIIVGSCNNEDINTITAIKIIPSSNQFLVGETVNFEVKANNSSIITENSIIKVNGEILEGTTFTAENSALFDVQAFYNEITSDVINIESVYPSGYIKNALIEDYTGTWCVNCPNMIYAIEQAKNQSDKIISVGIHAYDPMQMDGFEEIANEFALQDDGLVHYPSGRLNRINDWDDPDHNIQTATKLTGYGATLGLSITSSINTNNIEANIRIGFYENISTPLKLVVYLTENGLIYDQDNSTPYYGGPGTMVDFEHNDVLRAVYTHYLGVSIPADETIENAIYEYHLNKAIPTSVSDNNQLHLVAFVSNANTNEVINVREVKVGEEQDFQKLD